MTEKDKTRSKAPKVAFWGCLAFAGFTLIAAIIDGAVFGAASESPLGVTSWWLGRLQSVALWVAVAVLVRLLAERRQAAAARGDERLATDRA